MISYEYELYMSMIMVSNLTLAEHSTIDSQRPAAKQYDSLSHSAIAKSDS